MKPSEEIDQIIAGTPGWRGKTLARIRVLIKQADPAVTEEVKWKKPSKPSGVPVFYHDGIMCHAEAFKDHVRLTFLKGADLPDPKGLFDPDIGRNAMRAILVHEGEKIDEEGVKALIHAAVALSSSKARA